MAKVRATESVKLKNGEMLELPILDMRGKPYLMAAHRIYWFRKDRPNGYIKTSIVRMEKDESICTAEVGTIDEQGRYVILGTATKREDAKGFPDHLEKAETGAIGRALALAGYGTQFTGDELDEGARLADSPVAQPKLETPTSKPTEASAKPVEAATKVTETKPAGFKKPGKKEVTNEDTAAKQSGATVSSGGSGTTEEWT